MTPPTDPSRPPSSPGSAGTVPGAPPEPSRTARPLPRRLARPVAALASGLLLYLAFPPVGWWPLAPVGVAGLTLTVSGVRLRRSYLLGFLFGLGFCVPLLRFVTFVGLDGWLVLAVAEAAVLAVVAPATTAVVRTRGRWAHGQWLWVAAVWVGQEALRGRAPFGGFPWGRLAFSQPDGPFTPLAALGGAPLVTAAVAAVGAVGALLANTLLAAVRTAQTGTSEPTRPARTALARVGAPLAAAVALTVAGLAVPLPTSAQTGTLDVAAVQGDVPDDVPDGGVDALGRPFQVTLNHVAGTETLAADVQAGRRPRPDLVLWPENSSDVDPFVDARAAEMIDRAADAIGVPMLVGAVLDGPGDDHVRNAGLVWTTDGWTGQMYVKQHPVPFGEYLPGRALLEKVVGRFAAELPRDFLAGDTTGVIDVAGTTIGDVICFEVAYDGLVRETVNSGAQLLVVQTNNASFGRRGESEQQLAMTRLRAVEHGRAIVQVSTTGQSALVAPDGTVLAQSGLYEPALLSGALPLRTSRTLADRAGIAPEAVLVVLGLVAIMAGYRSTRTGRRDGDSPTGPTAEGDENGTDDGAEVEERSRVDGKRVVVCVPTYNERENLGETARRLRDANPDVHLLVIDDASPDGTGKIADELAAEDDHVHVLHRGGKSGLGSAYVAGFRWALDEGFDVVVEMDADGSHQPEELPKLLGALDRADLVIGSRWVDGGEVRNWPRRRLVLSRSANAYVRVALGIPVRDATAGFRAYRADVLRDRELDSVDSQGYCFQVDLAWQAWRAGWRVAEVPITFVERERGTSKMSHAVVAEGLWRVAWWVASTPRRRPRARPTAPVPVDSVPVDNVPSLPADSDARELTGASVAVAATAEQRRPDPAPPTDQPTGTKVLSAADSSTGEGPLTH